MSKIIIILIVINLIYCSNELYRINLKNYKKVQIPNMNYVYSLYRIENLKLLGIATYKVVHYRIYNRLFYKITIDMKMNWKDRHYKTKKKLFVNNESLVKSDFTIVRFKSILQKDKKIFHRSGFYKKPYLYIKENNINYRIFLSEGIYSSLIEQYLIYNKLLKKGDSFKYNVFNLMTMNIDKERIKFKNEFKNDKLKEIYITDYFNNRQMIYWLDFNKLLLYKKDFNGTVLWVLNSYHKHDKKYKKKNNLNLKIKKL